MGYLVINDYFILTPEGGCKSSFIYYAHTQTPAYVAKTKTKGREWYTHRW
jgi:hypothetical protein